MGNFEQNQLGIVVLHDPPEAVIDIVAVHGLGANPDWAWIRKVKEGDKELRINWLADDHLLPAAIPTARIMTFNYASKWHRDAPLQRRSFCAGQLLTALDNKLKEQEPDNETRPIIFIGHSFGGIVIEEAIVQANLNPSFQYISLSTVGIIFLGTPHRGTEASKWGESIAFLGSKVGFDTNDSILKDLKKDSETLADLLHQFSMWLFRCSISTVCFFEQEKTDYGKRYGCSWKEMVVDVRSACIDGHRKELLPTDHFKINKYEGPNDPCYKIVAPIIVQMAHGAQEKVQTRLKPRTIAKDNSLIPPANLKCLQSLFLTNPVDDLAAIRRNKGERVEGTCEWLLVHPTYTAWSVAETSQVLRLIGGPGIGKTMISSFLVEELGQKAKRTPKMTFVYYFCDNKDEKRYSALAILRGLLLQLLRQLPILFKHIQLDYDQQQVKLFDNFDALWRILLNILEDPNAGKVYLLIDALDECKKPSQEDFLTVLAQLLHSSRLAKMRIKLLITSRPESDIQRSLSGVENQLHVDSGNVNGDLSKFIDAKIEELPQEWAGVIEEVRSALTDHAGGTFLWAALVLEDLRKTKRPRSVSKKLKHLPSGIYEVYDRILGQIEDDDQDIAKVIFRWVVGARRPLTVKELATVLVFSEDDHNQDTLPPDEDVEICIGEFRCCEPLIYLDMSNNTINLVHQSAKDYFLGNYLDKHTSLSDYRIIEDETQLFIFETCWAYLTVAEFGHGSMIVEQREDKLYQVDIPSDQFDRHKFLQYAVKEWIKHAFAVPHVFSNCFKWDRSKLAEASTLRDMWLLEAASNGQETVVRDLLEKGGSNSSSKGLWGQTPLSYATEGGHIEVVRVLLATASVKPDSRDISDRTPLSYAAERGHIEVVRVLLATIDVEPDSRDEWDRTPLSYATKGGHIEIVRVLLANTDVEPDLRDKWGRTPLSYAAARGHIEVVRVLLATIDIEPDSRDEWDRTPLSYATKGGHIEIVRVLLANTDVEPDLRDKWGRTPLSYAAARGHIEVVRVLLATTDVELDSRDASGQTPLSYAAEGGHIEVVRVLLATKGGHIEIVRVLLAITDVEPDSRDEWDRTPLSYATKGGHIEVVRVLLAITDVEPDSRDKQGRTPLSYATEGGHIEVVRVLLATAGVKPDSRDISDRTPLSYAAKRGHIEVVRVLLATIDVEPDSRDTLDRTPLSYAIEEGHIEIVRVLLAITDVEPDSRDTSNRTPLSYATNSEIVRVLLARVERHTGR